MNPSLPSPDNNKAGSQWIRIIQSSLFRRVLYAILAFIALLLTFRIGTLIGYQKAMISMRSVDNYQQIFLGKSRASGTVSLFFDNDGFTNAHGTLGQIIGINGSVLVLKGRDQTERSVLTSDDTLIKHFENTVPLADLAVGDHIIVIGSPNESGEIDAKLIRFLPPPPDPATASTSIQRKGN